MFTVPDLDQLQRSDKKLTRVDIQIRFFVLSECSVLALIRYSNIWLLLSRVIVSLLHSLRVMSQIDMEIRRINYNFHHN